MSWVARLFTSILATYDIFFLRKGFPVESISIVISFKKVPSFRNVRSRMKCSDGMSAMLCRVWERTDTLGFTRAFSDTWATEGARPFFFVPPDATVH